MTMTQSWGHDFNPVYKSSKKLIHTLIDVVSKGGNFLLNIGPTQEGLWQKESYNRFAEIGEWMDINSKAIYESKPIAPFKEENICYTQNKKDNTIYAIYLAKENEIKPPPKIRLKNIAFKNDVVVKMCGFDAQLKWERVGEAYVMEIPDSLRDQPPCNHAWILKIEY